MLWQTNTLPWQKKHQTIACSRLHGKKNRFWAPVLNIRRCGQQTADPPWPLVFGIWERYCARPASLYSHYCYLLVSMTLPLSLHWHTRCCCTLRRGSFTPRRGICSSVLTGSACWEGTEEGTPVSPRSCFFHLLVPGLWSRNTASSRCCMWGFFILKFSQNSGSFALTLVWGL